MLYISQQATHRMGYGSKLHHSIYLRIYLHITQLHCLIPQKKVVAPHQTFLTGHFSALADSGFAENSKFLTLFPEF